MWKPAPGNRFLALLLVLALCVAVALTGCDTSVTPLEDSDPTPEQPASSDLSVALISDGMQHASSEDGPSYRCTTDVLDPEAEDGYRTYDLTLAFPDSVSADSSAEAESEFIRLNFSLSLDPTADSTAADPGETGCDDEETSEDEPEEEEPSVEEQLETLLEEDPYALLDVPCDLIPEWQNVAGHEIPNAVFDRLNTEALFENAEIQRLEDASGAVINMDRYSVTVSANGLPDGMNAEQYLNQVRMNINNYAEGANFQDTSTTRRCYLPNLCLRLHAVAERFQHTYSSNAFPCCTAHV